MKSKQIVVTRKVSDLMNSNEKFSQEVENSMLRYLVNDWGDLCDEDKEYNDIALKEGERILASYQTSQGKIWIITEWDRSVTTILFPDEY